MTSEIQALADRQWRDYGAREPGTCFSDPGFALDLARAALADCQKRGYQVAVAVVDRFGVPQVMLRDRYAGPHTSVTASGKAWTAAAFRKARVSSPSVSPA